MNEFHSLLLLWKMTSFIQMKGKKKNHTLPLQLNNMVLSQGTAFIELRCQHDLSVGHVSPRGESTVAREDCSEKR